MNNENDGCQHIGPTKNLVYELICYIELNICNSRMKEFLANQHQSLKRIKRMEYS